MITSIIIRIIKRIFRSMFLYYIPSIMTILFAILQELLFPNSPMWLIPLFLIIMIIIF